MSASSSTSSLLRKHRPNRLSPQPRNDRSAAMQRVNLEQHEAQRLADLAGSRSVISLAVSPISSGYSSQVTLVEDECTDKHQAVASTSSGISYLNMDPVCSKSCDYALPVCATHSSGASMQLAAAALGAIGTALPREKWQPDEESALCTYPLCSTIFGPPTYFSLGPRRHHCRMCGLLFCDSHSSHRASVLVSDANGRHHVSRERVCDMCVGKVHEDTTLSRRNSNASDISVPSEHLVTPLSEHPLSRTSSIQPCRSRELLEECAQASLAPVQGWMDRDGVLSLYPLAAQPSRSHVTVPPSAAPLFQPSLSARRFARVKEQQRHTLRQRRLGRDNDAWLPAKWGYRREDFDPEYESDDEEMTPGGLVVDGPIRYRAPGIKRVASGIRTPSEERPSMSTF
ncbi:hypothetical protein EHS25_006867 [Saitozyma podzolica]|uniref:FYVE-type domain-containing protein n=1 Tax=Saitozyma podzolica TaxID=1890683 RepID=A0A427XRQ1_9TREE|nr:hypothetical protein EHS25_006867 [Saitozyma podzolica]